MYAYALITAVAVTILSGCATVTTGSSQEISVSTPPVTGALCTLTNPRGKWQVLTPGTANVLRSKGDLEVSCRKRGWNDAIAVNRSVSTSKQSYGPLAGFELMNNAVDDAMGASNSYTADFAVPMTPAPPPASETPAQQNPHP